MLVIGTSTGGTLAAWAMTDPAMAEDVAGVVLVSPNFAVADPMARLLEWPFARQWVPLVAGAERSFRAVERRAGRPLDHRLPDRRPPSLLARCCGACAPATSARPGNPALVLFSDGDRVVSAAATRAAPPAGAGR